VTTRVEEERGGGVEVIADTYDQQEQHDLHMADSSPRSTQFEEHGSVHLPDQVHNLPPDLPNSDNEEAEKEALKTEIEKEILERMDLQEEKEPSPVFDLADTALLYGELASSAVGGLKDKAELISGTVMDSLREFNSEVIKSRRQKLKEGSGPELRFEASLGGASGEENLENDTHWIERLKLPHLLLISAVDLTVVDAITPRSFGLASLIMFMAWSSVGIYGLLLGLNLLPGLYP